MQIDRLKRREFIVRLGSTVGLASAARGQPDGSD
jgi:hypothetical protein